MYIHVGGELQLLVLNVHRGVETLSQLHVPDILTYMYIVFSLILFVYTCTCTCSLVSIYWTFTRCI